MSEEFFGGEESAVEVRVNVITDKNSKGIIGEYITFSKVIDLQIKKYGRNDTAVKEAIRICKDGNILKEFLEEYEREVWDIMISLFDQEEAREIREYNIKMESEAKGRAEGKEDVAVELIKNCCEPAFISKVTQLSLERINELKAYLTNTLQSANE